MTRKINTKTVLNNNNSFYLLLCTQYINQINSLMDLPKLSIIDHIFTLLLTTIANQKCANRLDVCIVNVLLITGRARACVCILMLQS